MLKKKKDLPPPPPPPPLNVSVNIIFQFPGPPSPLFTRHGTSGKNLSSSIIVNYLHPPPPPQGPAESLPHFSSKAGPPPPKKKKVLLCVPDKERNIPKFDLVNQSIRKAIDAYIETSRLKGASIHIQDGEGEGAYIS